MFGSDVLDHHLISTDPAPLYMGELPRYYSQVPTEVIINLCGMQPNGSPYGNIVLSFPMLDSLETDMLTSRERLERFLAAVHAQASQVPTYWHCHAGINRSGLAVAAYLHLYRGYTISDAIHTLRIRRTAMVLCNSLFEKTLREWYGGPDEKEFAPVDIEKYLRERMGRFGPPDK